MKVTMNLKKLLTFDFKGFRGRSNSSWSIEDKLRERSDSLLSIGDGSNPSLKENLEVNWQQIIGYGHFSLVYGGSLKNTSDRVAVKIMKDYDIMNEQHVYAEVSIMQEIGEHEFVLDLLGTVETDHLTDCSFGTPPIHGTCIITPICLNGSLVALLRTEAAETNFPFNSEPDLSQFAREEIAERLYEPLKFSYQIAQGMDFISSKGIIHGDLACRNVLLDSRRNCKISDFGLSVRASTIRKSISGGSGDKRQKPWRWMALECLMGKNISTNSDVWSYAVTLWEIFTMGARPFPTMTWNKEFMHGLETGTVRLQKPALATEQIYDLFLACWNCKPESRPGFNNLVEVFLELFTSNRIILEPGKLAEIEREKAARPESLIVTSPRQSTDVDPDSYCDFVYDENYGVQNSISSDCECPETPTSPNNVFHEILIRKLTMDQSVDLQAELDIAQTIIAFDRPISSCVAGNMSPVFHGSIGDKHVAVKVHLELSKRSLLDLRIVTHLNAHQNLVPFLGYFHAHADGRSRVNIVMEYCPEGTLRNYLLHVIRKEVVSGGGSQLNGYNGSVLTTILCKFSSEIACGMEYLTQKRVVHRDLCTRKVLLDSKLVCRIQCSSLSRRLHEQDVYITKKKEPIQWRYTPLDALQTGEFSLQTDVWSFGVLLWEIFSLGELPFRDSSFDAEFVTRLTSGLRLPHPEFAIKEIYSIMLECWHDKSESRPTFEKLKKTFGELVQMEPESECIFPDPL